MNAWPTVTAWLVDFDSWWIFPLVGLAVLNLWQALRGRDIAAKLAHVFEHGHAPDGKALVPEYVISAAEPPVLAKSQAVEVDDWADGTWPGGHVPAADELKRGRAVRAKPTVDPAALAAARSYRVATAVYGPGDAKTRETMRVLMTFDHWSDVLVFAGGDGFDSAVEGALVQKFRAVK